MSPYDDEPDEWEEELELTDPWWVELAETLTMAEFYEAEDAFELWADQEARLINVNPTEA